MPGGRSCGPSSLGFPAPGADTPAWRLGSTRAARASATYAALTARAAASAFLDSRTIPTTSATRPAPVTMNAKVMRGVKALPESEEYGYESSYEVTALMLR